MKFPRWWGDCTPGAVKRVYGRRRKAEELRNDRARFSPQWWRRGSVWWCTDTGLALATDETDRPVPSVELLPERVEAFNRMVIPGAEYVLKPAGERDGCLAFQHPDDKRIVLEEVAVTWLDRDYVQLVERQHGEVEWRCRAKYEPSFALKGELLVAVLMGVNR